MKSLFSRFWAWYERHYALNVSIAAGLFLLQLFHLYWLTTDVVFLRLFEQSFFSPSPFWEFILIFVDYTEIPAIITTSLLYFHEFRSGKRFRAVLYLFLLNSQWLHIFWITDEFVVSEFFERGGTVLPVWLAWIAIGIDYLELPVIYDTIKKALHHMWSKRRFLFTPK